ncbi:hypothetical protein CALCODRAFT_511438 [Calocera cornea HHB12733]|uniref:Uncharacterized protein n=1 Tax=Calocera cornea HHB12733 TaxID=1353952 RepID=A0A165DRP7_9BASI|nr:hypothetical protein CALCODRAFT_511438 [Calocera cornea HHB12733]
MPPRRSARRATKQVEMQEPESTPAQEAQNAFANALSSRGKGGQIVDVVLPTSRRKRKAATPEPAPSSPPAATYDAEDIEEEEDDDDDAPEPVSMKSGRKVAEDEAKRVKEFEERRREANKKRDQALKERADAQGGGRKKRKAEVEESAAEGDVDEAANIPLPPSDDVDSEQREAEERMKRAMAEADEEDEEEEEGEGHLQEGDVEIDEQDDDATAVSGEVPEGSRHIRLDALLDEEEENIVPQQASIPRHLPDHLFASAAAAMSEAQKKERSLKKANKTEKSKEKEGKKRRRDAMKDRVVGSRTVRVLPSQPQPDTGAKTGVAAALFVRQRLNLTEPQNGAKRKKNLKGWERKAAHLAISQGSSGPARGFARSLKR